MASRKRAEEKAKKTLKNSLKKNRFQVLAVIALVLIISVSGAAVILTDSFKSPEEKDNGPGDEGDITGKWLFAMDTANVQYSYGASAIPTLVIIDPDGNVVYYNRGVHTKEQLLPYVESAMDGTAESLGEAIDFTLTTFDGQTFKLSEKEGKVVILDIMGVGCPPCEMQMPELQKIKQEKGENIIILSVDTYYRGETKEDVINTYGEYIKR